MTNRNKILIGAVCILLALGGISAYMDGENDSKETGAQESVIIPT